MDRILGLNTIDLGGGRRGFRGKDTVGGVPGTELRADWHNAVQEEVMAAIEGSGLTAAAGDLTQLLQAIRRIARQSGGIFAFAQLCDFANTGYNVTYTRAGGVVTCTLVNHSLRVGDVVPLSVATDAGINGNRVVTSTPTLDTFTFANPNGSTASGSFTIRSFVIASKNIASFVQNGDGDFTFTFTTPPTKIGYGVAGAASKYYNLVSGNPNGYTRPVFQTLNTCRVSINDGTVQSWFRFTNIIFVGDLAA